MKYREMTAEQRKAEFEKVSAEFEAWKAKGLKLNMARGRPGKEQLDLVSDILSVMTDPADCVDGDVNVRNYGQLSGLPSAKALFAEILGCKPEQVFVGGNASLLHEQLQLIDGAVAALALAALAQGVVIPADDLLPGGLLTGLVVHDAVARHVHPHVGGGLVGAAA